MKYLKVKKIFDMVFSIIFSIIFLPLLLLISIILFITHRKIIFKQERSGLHNKSFIMYKFNTIDNGKIDIFCKLLRITGLDELPQLFNIIKGDMSFIGPRAWVLDYSKYFNDYQLQRLNVLPGITGYSQVSGRYKLNIFEKIEHDIYYVNNVSILFDIKVIIKTIFTIFRSNSYIYDYQKEIDMLKKQEYDFNPLVSIIVPNYNKEKYIEKCIDSVLKQSYTNYELIIVDDGSTDNSIDIINRYNSNKIKLIKLSKNTGIANARNKGIKCANGRMICFLDSDDYWNKDKLKIQVNYMIQNKISFCFSEYYFVRDDKIVGIAYTPHTLVYKEALKNTIIWTSTVMIDTNVINKKLIYMPDVPRQDTACWYTILKNGYTAYSINYPLSYYVRHSSSESANKFRAIKLTWNLYHNFLGLNFIKTNYYFCYYLFNTVKKRLHKRVKYEKD